jgi:chromate transporter
VCILLWLLPVGLLLTAQGPGHVFTDLAVYFSKLAVLTFGGAYAVLGWVTQAAVEQFGWLQPADMINGLALAETTPGPLILVLQFVGFLAAWNAPGAMAPMLAAVLGAVLTVWVTFLPCFAWIFLGAPHAERLRSSRLISAALTAVTAAVVGVIAHLALWFALHSLFAEHRASAIPLLRLDLPVPGSANWVAIVLAATALAAVFGLRLGFGRLLIGAALAGAGLAALGLT